jgi:hypothetical protein
VNVVADLGTDDDGQPDDAVGRHHDDDADDGVDDAGSGRLGPVGRPGRGDVLDTW